MSQSRVHSELISPRGKSEAVNLQILTSISLKVRRKSTIFSRNFTRIRVLTLIWNRRSEIRSQLRDLERTKSKRHRYSQSKSSTLRSSSRLWRKSLTKIWMWVASAVQISWKHLLQRCPTLQHLIHFQNSIWAVQRQREGSSSAVGQDSGAKIQKKDKQPYKRSAKLRTEPTN